MQNVLDLRMWYEPGLRQQVSEGQKRHGGRQDGRRKPFGNHREGEHEHCRKKQARCHLITPMLGNSRPGLPLHPIVRCTDAR